MRSDHCSIPEIRVPGFQGALSESGQDEDSGEEQQRTGPRVLWGGGVKDGIRTHVRETLLRIDSVRD